MLSSDSAPSQQPDLHVTSRPSKFIKAGDLVIIFISRDKPPLPLTITPGQELNNNYGTFLHDSMIGLPFGAKIASRNARGFVHVLRPNSELWTLALPHRTQILYTPDMSFITAHLGITPGARVIEAGTGSGSFSHYLTRTVARNHLQSRGVGWKGKAVETKGQDQRNGRDTRVDKRDGRVWSFEFHAGRAVKAWNEFEDHGLFPTLSLRHRNVCKSGFGLQGVAEAVFLDLPAPWEALQHAAKALRNDVACRICCFSPCVEQVLKTVAALRRGGNASREGEVEAVWADIETYECLNRTHMTLWTGPGGQTSNAPIEEAIARILSVEERKGRRREAQIEKAKRERAIRLQQAEAKADVEDGNVVTVEDSGKEDEAASKVGEKRKREEGEDKEQSNRKGKGAPQADVEPITARTKDGKLLHRSNVYSRTIPEMKGHTSYLTFATLLPRVVRQEADPTLEREKDLERRKLAGQEKARQRKAEREAEEKEREEETGGEVEAGSIEMAEASTE
ncbi:hypothetical protein CBS101457_003434 [Exobasidium rhododendri]|nr:hypothetical protein CBS101457_003434 [Exobasidium rhododendri]